MLFSNTKAFNREKGNPENIHLKKITKATFVLQ